MAYNSDGARSRTRTGTALLPRDFKSLVSTNSTISAFLASVEEVNASNYYNLVKLLYNFPLIFVPQV